MSTKTFTEHVIGAMAEQGIDASFLLEPVPENFSFKCNSGEVCGLGSESFEENNRCLICTVKKKKQKRSKDGRASK